MTGLTILYDQAGPVAKEHFSTFLGLSSRFKSVEAPSAWASSSRCLAAGLVAPASLQREIVCHPPTGSWLIAAGTLIDPAHRGGALDGLLADYLDQGADVLARLDGQFALAIYDQRSDRLAIVSDPFGMIPIYYAQKGSRFYISTSALAIARLLKPSVDGLRARSFILYGDSLGHTLWQGVNCLAPASVLTVSPSGAQQQVYWKFAIDPRAASYSEPETVECLLDSFSQTMRGSLGREDKLWVSLTGGLDSRMTAALAAYSQLPFKSYCHGPVDSRDVRIAEQISQTMGWDYEYFPLPGDWGTQRVDWLARSVGQTDGALNALKMTRTIREQTIKAQQLNVSLWGYGGEIYRGYYWKQEFQNIGRTSRVDYDRLLSLRMDPLPADILADGKEWKQQTREALREDFVRVGEQEPSWPNTVKLDLIGVRIERQSCGGTVAAVLGQQRVPMPFYYKENLIHSISAPYRWRTHGRMFRLLLERINPRLAGMQTADGGPALPMRFSNAHRFIPYWLDTGEKLAWKLSNKYLGKSLWAKRNPGQDGRSYPFPRWLDETVFLLQKSEILLPEKMHSAALYDPAQLKALLEGAQPWSQRQETLIDHVITVEMALRLTETDF